MDIVSSSYYLVFIDSLVSIALQHTRQKFWRGIRQLSALSITITYRFTKVIIHTLCDSIVLLRIAIFPGVIGALLNGFLSFFLSHYLRRRLIIPQKIVYLNLSISETLFSVVAFALRGPGWPMAVVLLFTFRFIEL